jgi:hypothetical protein
MKLTLPLIFLVLFFSASSVMADFDKGSVAYNKGDYATALVEFEAAAQEGGIKAHYNLGVMYESGQGVKQDYVKAVEWYRKAADQGHSGAQFDLGVMYANGQGVKQDYLKAFEWFQKAAEQGDKYAQSSLGTMYYSGDGVKQDYLAAFDWYQKAAEQGDKYAQSSLGTMYYSGDGVKQDYLAAFDWYQKAADQGDALGLGRLGVMYEDGLGVKQDVEKALYLYKKSNSGWALARYETLFKRHSCNITSTTKLFEVPLKCAKRNEMMIAVKQGGADAKLEDKNKWGDTYYSSSVLKGTSELLLLYTVDDLFAKAEYTFPSRMDSDQIIQVRDFVSTKYGQPDSSSGSTSAGAASFEWYLEDGITLKVNRGWPNTTTTKPR